MLPLGIIIAVLSLMGLGYAYLSNHFQMESKPNRNVVGGSSAPPTVGGSAESATPEIRKAKPVQPANAGTAGLMAPRQELDRIDETVAMMKRVPHESLGHRGVSMIMVVRPGTTDAQLSDLVRTYERNGVTDIIIYDDLLDAKIDRNMKAFWNKGSTRVDDNVIYRWYRTKDGDYDVRRVKEVDRK
jgi:hypothetical protein